MFCIKNNIVYNQRVIHYELDIQVVRVQFPAGSVALFTSPQHPELLLIHLCFIHWVSQRGRKEGTEVVVIARSEPDGTRLGTVGEVKGKDANGVGSQQPCTVRWNMV